MITVRSAITVSFVMLLQFAAAAQPAPQPPIEAYGERAGFRSVSMSPSGEQFAFIRRADGRDILYVFNESQGSKPMVDVTDLQGNWIWFATEEHIILRGYDTLRVQGYRGKFDYSAAFSYSLKTGKFKHLLRKSRDIYPAQTGLGKVIGRLDETGEVLMPAWTGNTDDNASRAVFKTKLDSTRGRIFKQGNPHTLDWVIAPDGTMLAREDMNSRHSTYSIHTEVDGKTRKIFEREDVARPPYSVVGVTADRSALILLGLEDSDRDYYQMTFQGEMSPMTLGPRQESVERFFRDKNGVIHGIEYSGLMPSYHFFDPEIDAAIDKVVTRFEFGSVEIVDQSDDWSKILLNIFDSTTSGRYILLDTATGELSGLLTARPDIPAEAVGEVNTIEYFARDGLKISAILTWPAGSDVETRKNLPTIIMPHGGPRSYDKMSFDWLAQYFANRGYLVLQPNFRGSSGFTLEFMNAGNGEWGGKMQDDVTDGLQALITSGLTDPDRTCIVGWSYGGYSALVGGAFTPELYDCVVAVAPVTDLRRLFRDEKRDVGDFHYTLSYWTEMIGDPDRDREKLQAKSPVNYPEAFQAPVLLIHGRDDSVVDFRHSKEMEEALRKAGKDVELKIIKGDGHSLVDSEARLDALKAIAAFVESSIGESASTQ